MRQKSRDVAGVVTLSSLLLVLGGCGFIGGPERRLEEARQLLDRGEYSTAVITARNAARKDPAHAGAQLLLARAQLLASEPESASASLDAAQKAGAPRNEVDELRARLLLQSGRPAELLEAMASNGQLALEAAQRDYFRARALQGLRRYSEALHAYRELASPRYGEADRQYRIAECQLALGRPGLAFEAIDDALAAEADFAPAWIARADLLDRRGDPDGALAAARRAVAVAPGRLDLDQRIGLHVGLIRRALATGDVQTATAEHAALVKLAPQADSTRVLGWQLGLTKGEVPSTLAQIQGHIERAPQDGAARGALIAARLVENEPALAAHQASLLVGPQSTGENPVAQLHRQIDRLTSLQADSVERAIGRAQVLQSMDFIGPARRVLEEVAPSAPDSLELGAAMAGLEIRAGRPAMALERARTLAAAHADSAQALLTLAVAQSAVGDHAAAAATYERLWRAAPSGPVVLALTSARSASGIGDEAQPLREWLQRRPGDVRVRAALAQAELEAGRVGEAVRHYEQALAASPDSAVILNNLAEAYARAGDRRALATARRAHELAPETPQILDTYGWLLVQSGEVGAGVELLRKASAAAPDSMEIRYHLATAQARAGDVATARVLLEDVLADPRAFAARDAARKLLTELQSGPA